jgi:2-polyprenyl-3-methyl-5-hydroxy-6-metoxy-1,4-benzoquinol methylase
MTRLAETRTTCRLCKSRDLWNAVPLSALPVASPNVGRSAKVSETAPADLWQCRGCGFLQLNTVVNPEFQYRNFKYFTGISVGLREHFGALVGGLARSGDVAKDKQVLDIGSNDGSLLRFAKDLGAGVLGIDPAEKIAKAATAAGIPTLAEFFDRAMGKRIRAKHGLFDVVISNNTVANIDDLDDFFGGIAELISPAGLVIIETQYGLDVLEKTLLDVVYHEHVSYFSVKPTRAFLEANGFELVDAEKIAPKGGSIRFHIQKKGGPRQVSPRVATLIAQETSAGLYGPDLFAAFNMRIHKIGEALRRRLANSRKRTGRALCYGSSVGCVALVHYFELGSHIDAVFDDTPLTNVMRTTVGQVPVLSGKQLANEEATEVIVLAWRYTDKIEKSQADFVRSGGRFVSALPEIPAQT